MLYIAFVCIFLSIFLFTYNKNHLSKKKYFDISTDSCVKIFNHLNNIVGIAQNTLFLSQNCV